MCLLLAVTYTITPTMKIAKAAGTDHQIRAATTGRPIRIHAPTVRVSMPLALLSAKQDGINEEFLNITRD